MLLLGRYLENAQEAPFYGVARKWQFVCPFCGPLGCTEGKKKRQKKAALFWNGVQNSWVFTCAKKGSAECMAGKTLGNLISALNPALGEAYKRDRWHSGTRGKGHTCALKESILWVSTGSFRALLLKSPLDKWLLLNELFNIFLSHLPNGFAVRRCHCSNYYCFISTPKIK